MKRTCIISILFFSLLLSVQAQSHSWDGKGLYPKAHIRTLNIFANIIFDVDSTMDPVAAPLPTYHLLPITFSEPTD